MPISSLSKLTARDIMKSKVLRLDPHSPLEEAVRTLTDMRISGAPVVDRHGRLVGVLSVRDVAQPEHLRHGRGAREERSLFPDAALGDDESDDDSLFSMEDYGPRVGESETVEQVMSPDPITVAPNASLRTVCALMVREGIHRVIVVEDGKLVGIVTTLDVVRAVAEAS